jgi:hypothetical protein
MVSDVLLHNYLAFLVWAAQYAIVGVDVREGLFTS